MELIFALTQNTKIWRFAKGSAFILFLVYFYAMFLHPFCTSGFDWTYVQSVWTSWQTLNASVVALTASLVAITFAQYASRAEKQQNLHASLAFLDSALFEISRYSKKCIDHYKKVIRVDRPETTIITLPEDGQPTEHREIFKDCIKYSDPNTRKGLTKILSDLQSLSAEMQKPRTYSDREDCVVQANKELARFLTLTAKISALYPVARLEVSKLELPISNKHIKDVLNKFKVAPSDALAKELKVLTKADNLMFTYDLQRQDFDTPK